MRVTSVYYFNMFSPEPSDPQDAEVANMYLSNYDQWASMARYLAYVYCYMNFMCIYLKFHYRD